MPVSSGINEEEEIIITSLEVGGRQNWIGMAYVNTAVGSLNAVPGGCERGLAGVHKHVQVNQSASVQLVSWLAEL